MLTVSTITHAANLHTEALTITEDEVLDLSGFIEWCSAKPERTVEEISNGGCAFLPTSDKEDLKHGLSSRAFWIKFELHNPTSNAISRWIRVGHPRLQSVTLYALSQQGVWSETKAGLDVPAMKRPIVTEFPILPIELQPYEKRIFFVRVASETLIDLSTSLMTPRAYILSTRLSRLISYMALGAALLASIFCMIIFTRLRETSLLLLAGTLVSTAFLDAGYTGLTAMILWPANAPFPIRMQAATLCFSLICFSAFIFSYIPYDVRLKRIKIIIFIMLCISTVLALYSLAVSYREALPYIIIVSLLAIASLLILTISARRIGIRPPISILWCLVPILLIGITRWMIIVGLVQELFIQSIGFSWALTILSPVIISGIVKHAEEQRRRLAEIAMDASIRSEFITNMSHEFRSPLNLIISYADLVTRNSSRVTITEAMAAIRQGGHELLSLIDGILDYMKKDSNEVSLDLAPTKLLSFLDGIASEATQLSTVNSNHFNMSVSGAIPLTVEIDQLRLKQVLRNLIGNANRYTKHGAVMLNCHSERTSAGKVRLSFSVSDTGFGIELSDLSRIFEPYVRGAAARYSGQKGFGIGLSLSRSIVEMMGSSLSVISSPGSGSKFYFSIDCAVVMELERPQNGSIEDNRSRKVLLVDDDPQALLLLRKLLNEFDAKLITARSGNEAQELLDKVFDLIITDQFMENGDGWHVLAGAAAYRIPVILISAAEPQRPPGLDQALQFAAVFRKPIDIEALYTTVRHMLGISVENSRSAETSEIVERLPDDLPGAPDEEQLSILRQLVREGAVSKIDDWVADGEAKHPEHSDFYVAVRSACSRLDFPKLAELARDGNC